MAKSGRKKSTRKSKTSTKKPAVRAPAESAESAEPVPAAPPSYTKVHVWQIQAVRDILVVAAAVGILWAGYLLRAVTVPLLVALLLAYLFEPVVVWMCLNPKVKRSRAVGSIVALMIAVVVVFLAFVTPLLIGQTAQIVQDVRQGEMRSRIETIGEYLPVKVWNEMHSFVEMLPAASATPADDEGGDGVMPVEGPMPAEAALTEARVQEIVAAEVGRVRDELAAQPRTETTDWLKLARGGAAAVSRVIAILVTVGLLTCLIPFYFFFFSLWYPAVVRFGRSLLPEKNRQRTLELLGKMDGVVSGFVRGRIIISLIMGVLLAIGWFWPCQVPYAIVLGLGIGIFCAIPYLGLVGIPIAIGLAALKYVGNDAAPSWWLWAIGPAVWFGIVQLIEGWLLTPAIAGKATRLDPVTILAAVLAGGSVLGVYGMLLSIPVAACLKIVFMEVLLPKIRDWAAGRAADPLPIDPH